MAEEHPRGTKAQLALALAQGVSAAKWARDHDVAKMTAYRWAKDPVVRKTVESFRRRTLDRAVGRMTKRCTWAADGIASIAKNSESDSVRLRACRAIFSDMMAVSKYSGLEVRMTEIEVQLQERAGPR